MTESPLTALRRRFLLRLPALAVVASLSAAAILSGCDTTALQPSLDARPPIVFMPGNGDSAALWQTTIWRFESNGWPRDRLYAVDVPYPNARDQDDKPQPARTSAAENRDFLASEVDRVLDRTGASRVVLVGNSRGGLAIRSYVRSGGAGKVSQAILGGAPDHGVWADDTNLSSEFNGRGPFMTALNSPQGPNGEEVTPGVKWLTLRSDDNDKYAQPMGVWIGRPNDKTNVGFDGPALKGATNLVLPGVDHRETSYSPQSFEETWQFIVGSKPGRSDIAVESRVTLNGRIAALEGTSQTNRPLPGARLEVYEVSAQTGERLGPAKHDRVVGADGLWGPFEARADAFYEFVVAADGYANMHIYRSPFPRSSSVVHLRPVRMADADRSAGAVVTMTRPRGYFDTRRDHMSLDGKAPPGIPPGVAGVAASKLTLPEGPQRTVVADFNGERIAVRTWPAKESHVVFAEMHY